MIGRLAGAIVVGTLGFGCGGKSGNDASSSTATAASGAPSARAAGSSNGASSAQGASSGAPTAQPTITAAAFCDRAVKIGEGNLAKCNKDDENQRTFLDFKPTVASAKDVCTTRLSSPNVVLHGDIALQCLAAAEKRGGDTSFAGFNEIAECRGVLSGKVGAGQAAANAEECEPGLSHRAGKCEAPAKLNADCATDSVAMLAKLDEHPSCEAGLACVAAGEYQDGVEPPYRCVKAAIGERCDLLKGNCPLGASCYQGKCRAQGELGSECMNIGDCKPGSTCEIPGGLFGKCVAPKPLGETCKEGWDCVSRHCRARKCTSFCGGPG